MKLWVFIERWCLYLMLLERSINKIWFWKTCEGQVSFSCSSSCLFWITTQNFFSFFGNWRRHSVHHVIPKEVLLSFCLFVAALAWGCPSDSTQDHLHTLRSNQPMVSVPSCSALSFPSDHWWPLCKGALWIGEWVWSSNKTMWRLTDSVGVV